MSNIEAKCFTTSDYNKFTSEILETKIKKGLVCKSSISNIVKMFDLNRKIVPLATKAKLLANQNELVKFWGLDSSYFHS